MKTTANDKLKTGLRISLLTITGNAVLTVFKLIAGLIGKSMAMISDAVHSASDVLSTLIVMAGLKIAAKKSDDKHQFGHERFECVAAIILAFMLLLTGAFIGYTGIKSIAGGNYDHLTVPTLLPLIAAIVSIAVKEAMYWYTRNGAKKINSGALMADAWHHRSDALSSIGSFIGILGARLGLPILDPIAAIVICLFIIKAAITVFIDAIRKMTDESCDKETVKALTEVIAAEEGVKRIDVLKTRKFGDKMYVEVEISVDCALSLVEAHSIAERVHHAIECAFETAKHCSVHVNPFFPDGDGPGH